MSDTPYRPVVLICLTILVAVLDQSTSGQDGQHLRGREANVTELRFDSAALESRYRSIRDESTMLVTGDGTSHYIERVSQCCVEECWFTHCRRNGRTNDARPASGIKRVVRINCDTSPSDHDRVSRVRLKALYLPSGTAWGSQIDYDLSRDELTLRVALIGADSSVLFPSFRLPSESFEDSVKITPFEYVVKIRTSAHSSLLTDEDGRTAIKLLESPLAFKDIALLETRKIAKCCEEQVQDGTAIKLIWNHSISRKVGPLEGVRKRENHEPAEFADIFDPTDPRLPSKEHLSFLLHHCAQELKQREEAIEHDSNAMYTAIQSAFPLLNCLRETPMSD